MAVRLSEPHASHLLNPASHRFLPTVEGTCGICGSRDRAAHRDPLHEYCEAEREESFVGYMTDLLDALARLLYYAAKKIGERG